MPQSHPLHHMRRYCFLIDNKDNFSCKSSISNRVFQLCEFTRRFFPSKQKCQLTAVPLCILIRLASPKRSTWISWRELPGPWHLLKPKLGPIQSVQGTPPLLFTGELREVFQTESDGRLSSFTLPLGGPWGFSLHKTESNIPLFTGKN